MIEHLDNGKIRVHRNGRTFLYDSYREFQNDAPMHENHTFNNWVGKCKNLPISQKA